VCEFVLGVTVATLDGDAEYDCDVVIDGVAVSDTADTEGSAELDGVADALGGSGLSEYVAVSVRSDDDERVGECVCAGAAAIVEAQSTSRTVGRSRVGCNRSDARIIFV
jgi:hypothetical protein